MRLDGFDEDPTRKETIFPYGVADYPSGKKPPLRIFPIPVGEFYAGKKAIGMWHGAFETADQALAVLQNQLEFEMILESSDVDQIVTHKRTSQCQ